jgi:HSP20 family molecular chaperone IbpA
MTRHTAQDDPLLAPELLTAYCFTAYFSAPTRNNGCFTENPGERCAVNRRFRAFRLLQIQGKLGDVAYEMTRVNFLRFHPVETRWQPSVNIFLCPRCFRISADLAGVDPEEVELSVSNGKLLISGSRPAPEPPCEQEIEVARTKAVRVLAMEIDYGGFAREIALPDDVDLDRVKTEWNNGILWIEIPRWSQA